jgi:hypothetical protein
MTPLNIVALREDADELELWIHCDYTCKMISHLRNRITTRIVLSPIETGEKIIHDHDRFFLSPINGRREKIKKTVNGFCDQERLPLPTWPDNF